MVQAGDQMDSVDKYHIFEPTHYIDRSDRLRPSLC